MGEREDCLRELGWTEADFIKVFKLDQRYTNVTLDVLKNDVDWIFLQGDQSERKLWMYIWKYSTRNEAQFIYRRRWLRSKAWRNVRAAKIAENRSKNNGKIICEDRDCKRELSENETHVNHLDYDNEAVLFLHDCTDLSYLTCLCRSCHAKYHSIYAKQCEEQKVLINKKEQKMRGIADKNITEVTLTYKAMIVMIKSDPDVRTKTKHLYFRHNYQTFHSQEKHNKSLPAGIVKDLTNLFQEAYQRVYNRTYILTVKEVFKVWEKVRRSEEFVKLISLPDALRLSKNADGSPPNREEVISYVTDHKDIINRDSIDKCIRMSNARLGKKPRKINNAQQNIAIVPKNVPVASAISVVPIPAGGSNTKSVKEILEDGIKNQVFSGKMTWKEMVEALKILTP